MLKPTHVRFDYLSDKSTIKRDASTESRTRTSPNFGKTNIVYQFVFLLIFVLLQLLCRLPVCGTILSGCLQVGLMFGIKRSKLGVTLQNSCIPDVSDITIGRVRYCLKCSIEPDVSGIGPCFVFIYSLH